jgi:hypothetical protein
MVQMQNSFPTSAHTGNRRFLRFVPWNKIFRSDGALRKIQFRCGRIKTDRPTLQKVKFFGGCANNKVGRIESRGMAQKRKQIRTREVPEAQKFQIILFQHYLKHY